MFITLPHAQQCIILNISLLRHHKDGSCANTSFVCCFDISAYEEAQRNEWANNVFTRHRKNLSAKKKKRKECKVKMLKELS